MTSWALDCTMHSMHAQGLPQAGCMCGQLPYVSTDIFSALIPLSPDIFCALIPLYPSHSLSPYLSPLLTPSHPLCLSHPLSLQPTSVRILSCTRPARMTLRAFARG